MKKLVSAAVASAALSTIAILPAATQPTRSYQTAQVTGAGTKIMVATRR
jgi:hypothetical protein